MSGVRPEVQLRFAEVTQHMRDSVRMRILQEWQIVAGLYPHVALGELGTLLSKQTPEDTSALRTHYYSVLYILNGPCEDAAVLPVLVDMAARFYFFSPNCQSELGMYTAHVAAFANIQPELGPYTSQGLANRIRTLLEFCGNAGYSKNSLAEKVTYTAAHPSRTVGSAKAVMPFLGDFDALHYGNLPSSIARINVKSSSGECSILQIYAASPTSGSEPHLLVRRALDKCREEGVQVRFLNQQDSLGPEGYRVQGCLQLREEGSIAVETAMVSGPVFLTGQGLLDADGSYTERFSQRYLNYLLTGQADLIHEPGESYVDSYASYLHSGNGFCTDQSLEAIASANSEAAKFTLYCEATAAEKSMMHQFLFQALFAISGILKQASTCEKLILWEHCKEAIDRAAARGTLENYLLLLLSGVEMNADRVEALIAPIVSRAELANDRVVLKTRCKPLFLVLEKGSQEGLKEAIYQHVKNLNLLPDSLSVRLLAARY